MAKSTKALNTGRRGRSTLSHRGGGITIGNRDFSHAGLWCINQRCVRSFDGDGNGLVSDFLVAHDTDPEAQFAKT